MNKKKSVICLTPVRNESWILDKFLSSSSIWADYIIISDQGSDDNSRDIAKKYEKVKLISNAYKDYNEFIIRQVLFEEAGKIKGGKILIALDADEFFTPDLFFSDEWEKVLTSNPGTVIKSKFVNLLPDLQYYWFGPMDLPWGFIDDNSKYLAGKIHTNRIIYPEGANVLLLEKIKVMHFQYTDWNRMESKHRWYQCWERINNPQKSSVRIFRPYHHMYAVKNSELKKIPGEWFDYYKKSGIDLAVVNKYKYYYWDKLVLDYFNKYGTHFFKREDIWYINWETKARDYGYKDTNKYKDPRNFFLKIVHFWLRRTQYNHKNIFIRAVDKILVKFFRV
ncbi:MAG: glycosyltransferase family 2 protein [Actinobacteria bacterium]|nr:glycosyltransferase family 2 protein [Actinomycetota bacterium]MBM3711900.1 glycosyltransferase family 2 protein [Actinomycetota bacterium]